MISKYSDKTVKILLLFILVINIACKPESQLLPDQFNHYILNNQTLQLFNTENANFFLFFTTSDCKQCIPLEIEYTKLSKKLNDTNSSITKYSVKLAKIDGSLYKQVSKQYGVQSYPALFYFDHTFVVKYTGNLTANQIQKWVQQYMKDRVVDIQDQQQLNGIPKPYALLVGQDIMQSQRDSLSKSLFDIDKVQAYYLRQGSNQNGKLILRLKDKNVIFNEQIQRVAIKKWLQQNLRNSIVSLKTDGDVENVLFNKEKKSALVIVLPDLKLRFSQSYQAILQICNEQTDKIVCGQIFPKYPSFKGVHGYFKIKNQQTIIVGLVRQQMNIAHRMNMQFSKINKKSLTNFINAALNDQIQRVVDNVAPSHAKFQNVKLLTPQKLQQKLQVEKYVFVNFYEQTDNISLFFSRPYEALAAMSKNQEQLKQVQIVAINCVDHSEYCQKQQISFYPYIRLFINGVAIEYQKTQKLPQVPELTRFLHNKVSKKILEWKEEQSDKYQKPYLVFSCSQIPKKLQALPALFQTMPIYYQNSNEKQRKLVLHVKNEKISYSGQFKLTKIIKWIRAQTQQMLSDLLVQSPDKRLTKAVQQKKPILVLLDAQKQKSRTFRMNFGLICKKLSIVCGYADKAHPAYTQFLKWLQMEQKQQSSIVFIDIKTDKKYLLIENVQTITEQKIDQFMNDVKQGKIEVLKIKGQNNVETQNQQNKQHQQIQVQQL